MHREAVSEIIKLAPMEMLNGSIGPVDRATRPATTTHACIVGVQRWVARETVMAKWFVKL